MKGQSDGAVGNMKDVQQSIIDNDDDVEDLRNERLCVTVPDNELFLNDEDFEPEDSINAESGPLAQGAPKNEPQHCGNDQHITALSVNEVLL